MICDVWNGCQRSILGVNGLQAIAQIQADDALAL
jgi:hypothetical protein